MQSDSIARAGAASPTLADLAKGVWGAVAGDDIDTIRNSNSPLWAKALAVVDIATTVADPLKGGAEAAIKLAAKGALKAAEHSATSAAVKELGHEAVEHAAEAEAHGTAQSAKTESAAQQALTPAERRDAIQKGAHQVHVVDGRQLSHPSQDLANIEYRDAAGAPKRVPGEPHTVSEHVGKTDTYLKNRANGLDEHGVPIHDKFGQQRFTDASSFTDYTAAQESVHKAIVRSQSVITQWISSKATRLELHSGDVGRAVGGGFMSKNTVSRDALLSGRLDTREAMVILAKDASFPEGYKVLTSYPDLEKGAKVSR